MCIFVPDISHISYITHINYISQVIHTSYELPKIGQINNIQ